MQGVYDRYHEHGLEILAFPCNQVRWGGTRRRDGTAGDAHLSPAAALLASGSRCQRPGASDARAPTCSLARRRAGDALGDLPADG